jgi:hypothetical protein
MFADGGLKQDGNTTDPISGNDVPPGSLQKEVRDDIPAQLSEGEFVFPADVVRYVGLERLMQIRDEAKKGLGKMEEIGQMGNADQVANPEEPHGDEFANHIDSIMGELGHEQPKHMATGGLGFKAPAIEIKQFKDPSGKISFITYLNGQPATPLPAGAQEISEAKAVEEQKQTLTPTEKNVAKAEEPKSFSDMLSGAAKTNDPYFAQKEFGKVLGDVAGKTAKNVIKDIQSAFKSNDYLRNLSDNLDYNLAGTSKDVGLSGDMNNVASNSNEKPVVTTNEPGIVSETPEMNAPETKPTTPETYNGNKGGFVRKKK